jgi:outer membrane protein TolC
VPAGETLESLILTATEQRNELAVLKAEANSLRENSTAIRARSRPQFALTGGYMYLENAFLTADEFWMAGVSFQWNLFNAGRNRDRAAALERQALAVNHTRAAVDQAIENLRVVQNRYEAGSSANIEVLDAETLRQQALNNRDNARYELVLAKLRLARAVGAL